MRMGTSSIKASCGDWQGAWGLGERFWSRFCCASEKSNFGAEAERFCCGDLLGRLFFSIWITSVSLSGVILLFICMCSIRNGKEVPRKEMDWHYVENLWFVQRMAFLANRPRRSAIPETSTKSSASFSSGNALTRLRVEASRGRTPSRCRQPPRKRHSAGATETPRSHRDKTNPLHLLCWCRRPALSPVVSPGAAL